MADDLGLYVETDDHWKTGNTISADTQCWVECICGEEPSISDTPKKCKCGRIYWTEFRVYRMETKEQFRERIDMENSYNE